jgi:hypothetical protein
LEILADSNGLGSAQYGPLDTCTCDEDSYHKVDEPTGIFDFILRLPPSPVARNVTVWANPHFDDFAPVVIAATSCGLSVPESEEVRSDFEI